MEHQITQTVGEEYQTGQYPRDNRGYQLQYTWTAAQTRRRPFPSASARHHWNQNTRAALQPLRRDLIHAS